MRTYIVSVTYRSTVEVPDETSMAVVKDIVIERFAEHIADGAAEAALDYIGGPTVHDADPELYEARANEALRAVRAALAHPVASSFHDAKDDKEIERYMIAIGRVAPDGWKLVPVEAPLSMIGAGATSLRDSDNANVSYNGAAGLAYTAMLAAAPAPGKGGES